MGDNRQERHRRMADQAGLRLFSMTRDGANARHAGPPGKGPPEPRRPLWRRLAPLAMLALVMLGIFAAGLHRYLTLESLVAHRQALTAYISSNRGMALAAFMLVYVASTALSLPGGAILTIAGGFLFGMVQGGLIAVIAATTGACILFAIARTALGETLAARASAQLDRFAEGFRRNAAEYLLFLRLVPVFPFWLVNLAPALVGVDFRTFLWTTFVGVVPMTFTFAAIGAGLDSALAAQIAAFDRCVAAGTGQCRFSAALGDLVTRDVLLAVGALGVVALIPVALKRFGWLGANPTKERP
jgi:uncharacterized membrane protein YdjX (TVP38/TMEM64 family)